MSINPKLLVFIFLLLVVVGFNAVIEHKVEITNAIPSGESIVCFGDSLTFGTGASKGMDYPEQLSQMIGEPVINLGKPGDTTANALNRIDEVLKHDPRIVLITLGGNDLKNGVDKTQAFVNLQEIILQIQAQRSLVVIGGVDIPLFGRGFADEYEILAHKTGAVLVPNVFENIMGKAGLMSDRIHPNNAGYRIMAMHFYDAVKPYL